MKLLLIEDNAALQTTLQRSFERRGAQVVVCGDGARALDRWRASLPDVVLLDLSLPGEDGLSVLAAARAEGLQTPVLILTARGTVGDRVLGLNTGHTKKPSDASYLPGARAPKRPCLQGSFECQSQSPRPQPRPNWRWECLELPHQMLHRRLNLPECCAG